MSSASLFRDSQTSQILTSSTQKNKKKLTILVALSVIFFLITITMSEENIQIWNNKLESSKDENKSLEETISYFNGKVISLSDENKELTQQLTDLNNQIIVRNIHKHLNFTDLNMTGISINIKKYSNPPRESQIQVLDLTSNAFEVFEGNSIQTLQKLILDGNPLVSFSDNDFEKIQKLDFSKLPTLLKFERNIFNNLHDLVFPYPFTLTSISNNRFYRGDISFDFLFDNKSPILTFDGNLLQVKTLKFKRQKLSSFSSNDLTALQQLIIQPLSQNQSNTNNNPLICSKNKFHSTKTLSFSNQNLTMQGNQFTYLQTLIINQCSQVILRQNAFSLEQNSTKIQISNIYQKLTFQNNANLQLLKINMNNNISLLIEDSYIHTLQLDTKTPITIDFQGNKFSRLNKLVFSQNITFNKFSSNQFVNMIQLDFQNKQISEFKDNHLGIITTINLTQNNIPEFNNYKSNHLTYLDLFMNPLTEITNNEFQNLQTFRLGYYDDSRIINFSNNYLPLMKDKLFVSKASGVFNNNSMNSIITFIIQDARNLTSFNDNILSSVKSLTINRAQISQINNLKTFSKLEILNLQNCKFQSLENQLPHLTQLLQLVLTSNKFTSFNNYQHQKLQSLFIQDMNIESIMNNKLDSLVYFKQNSNVIMQKIINNSFASLKDILIFNSLNITQFSDNFLPQLQQLNLNLNYISQFTGNNLSRITSLNINNNEISSFQGNTINSNIQQISIQDNHFKSFSANTYPQLLKLNIRFNELSSFEGNKFQKLQILYLSNNNLSQIRNNIMPNIRELELSKNQFTENIAQQIEALNLSSLQKLILTNNSKIDIQQREAIETKIKEIAPHVVITW